MKNLEFKSSELPRVGELLGGAGISIEGGASIGDTAHFLVDDGDRAVEVLRTAGVEVVAHNVLVRRLHQSIPGQLGRFTRALAEAGVRISVLYSDHAQQLIVVTPDLARAEQVTWDRGSGRAHDYTVKVTWTGNTGAGTETYRSYKRDHIISAPGKELSGSSDRAFRGDATRWNPEELLLAGLSACHKLQYLHACAEAGVIVDAYTDEPTARMLEDGQGGGSFTSATLKPRVTLRNPAQGPQAIALHAIAHSRCFVAASLRFPIQVEPALTPRVSGA